MQMLGFLPTHFDGAADVKPLLPTIKLWTMCFANDMQKVGSMS